MRYLVSGFWSQFLQKNAGKKRTDQSDCFDAVTRSDFSFAGGASQMEYVQIWPIFQPRRPAGVFYRNFPIKSCVAWSE